jgi:hypothetical protein
MNDLKSIVEDTNADCAAIMVADADENYMYCYEHFNMPEDWVSIKNPFEGHSKTGNVHVYKNNTVSLVNDFHGEHFGHHQESYFIVPIVLEGATIGTLELVNTKKGKKFSQSDIEKASVFAKNIKIALN